MKALLYLLTFVISFSVFANNHEADSSGIISGKVITVDGQAAAYVTVLLTNTSKGIITDEEGKFEFRKIKPGNYRITASLLGYNPIETFIEVKQNETAYVKIQLQVTYAVLLEVIVKSNARSKYIVTTVSEGLKVNFPLVEIPQNIHVTSHQLLADQGSITMTEALRTVSGIQTNYNSLNDYQLIIRGTVGQFNVLRNGITGFWWNQQEDVEMLEKIEFIKGPTGFIMSMNEPGGIVNIVTKQPVEEKIASINAGFGSYNLFRLAADLGGAFSKKSNFSYRFNAGIHTQKRAFQFSKAYRYFICGAVTYKVNQKTSVTAEYNNMFGKTSGNNENLPSINGQLFALPRNFAVADAKTDQYTVRDNYYRLQLRHNFNDNWHVNFLAAYAQGYAHNHLVYADTEISVSNDTLYRYFDFSNWYNSSSLAQTYVDGKFYTGKKIEHKLLTGLDYCKAHVNRLPREKKEQKELGLYMPNPNYNIDPILLNTFQERSLEKFRSGWVALYLQDHIKIANKLVVTIAGRFTHSYIKWSGLDFIPDYLRNSKFKVFTPRAGLTWLFSENFSVYSLYDQCFVPPVAVPQSTGNIANKPFKPITGYNIETGLKSYFFNKKLGFNFSVYHIVKNNNLTADLANNGYFIQTGQVISNGIELDMTGNITPAITVNVNYAYNNAKITKDNDPNLINIKNFGTPDHSTNLWIKYQLLSGKLKGISLGFGYQYIGKRSALNFENFGTGNIYLPVYNLLDAAVSYTHQKFKIGLNLYNITNSKYAANGFYNHPNEWRYTPGEPVNFRLNFGVNLLQAKKDK